MPPQKLQVGEELEYSIRRAMVEVFTLRSAGRPLNDATNALDDHIIPDISNVKFSQAKDGLVTLTFPNDQVREYVLASTVASKPVEEVREAQVESKLFDQDGGSMLNAVKATPKRSDRIWLTISLKDPQIKFAVGHIVIHSDGLA